MRVGTRVELDGSGSSDPDGDALTYTWKLSAPNASNVTLSDSGTANPSFVPDVSGEYRVVLVVSDGVEESAPDDVMITAMNSQTNRAPIADAGADRTVDVQTEVTLDGRGSTDPDSDPLTYLWRFVTRPAGSTSIVNSAESVSASFTPDITGDYTLELTVSDGGFSTSDRVTISALPVVPVAAVFVSPEGDDANSGVEQAPVATVGRALEITLINATIQKIVLADGNYSEAFDYTLEATGGRELVLEGANRDTVVLDAGGGPMFTLGGNITLRMRRLTVRNVAPAVAVPDGTALAWTEVSCLQASQCIRANGEVVLIFPGPGGDVSVQDSLLEGLGPAASSTGISLSSNVTVFSGVTIRDFDTGIFAFAASFRLGATAAGTKSALINNNNGVSLLFTPEGQPASISNTTFRDNTVGARFESARGIIAQSIFEGQRHHGILLDKTFNGTSSIELRTSEVRGSGFSGVRTYGDATLIIDSGVFEDNGVGNPSSSVDRAGIYMGEASNLLASGLTARSNGQDNLVFLDDSTGQLQNATVSGSAYAGIYANTRGGLEVADSSFTGNYNGLFVRGGTILSVTGTRIASNRGDGINFGGDRLTLRNSDLQANINTNLRLVGVPTSVDLGSTTSPGGNLFMNGNDTDWSIYDRRSTSSGTAYALGNRYQKDNYSYAIGDSAFAGSNCGPGESDVKEGLNAIFRIDNSGNCLHF